MNPNDEIPDGTINDAVSFASVQRYAAETTQVRRTWATPAMELAQVFRACLAHCQVVSFDVFDTLLVRWVHDPRDVFLHLEKKEPFRRQTRWPALVWQLRQQAENQARRKQHQATGNGEVTLTEIYAAFCDLAQWRHPVAELVRAEEEVELKLCRPCTAIGKLYEMACAAGKRVIFVSDTYHHARFLGEMLTANSFPATPENLFVSSDRRLNKQSGELFPKIVEQIGLRASALLHVGDHPVSDFEQPQAIGIKAILHEHRASAVRPHKVFALRIGSLTASRSGGEKPSWSLAT
jgi:predicted HAD superfamily hydrolase